MIKRLILKLAKNNQDTASDIQCLRTLIENELKYEKLVIEKLDIIGLSMRIFEFNFENNSHLFKKSML